MYYPYYFHSQSPYGTEVENPFIFEERVRRERIRRELDKGRSGHYYRMTLASFGGRPRVVQLLSMDRDGMVSMRIYRRRQGRWVYHKEYHREIYDMNYLGKYYNIEGHHHDDYNDYDHNHRLVDSQFDPYIHTSQVDNEQYSSQNDGEQPEFRKYVGNFICATVEGLLPRETSIFIHESTIDSQGEEQVTIVYPTIDMNDLRATNAITVNAEHISLIFPS